MIRPVLPEELDCLCDRIAAMDPWKSLGIEGEVMASNTRFDKERNVLVWSEHGTIYGAAFYRPGHFAQLVYFRGFGEALSQHHNLTWPCDWEQIPDGGYLSGLAVFPGNQGRGIGSSLIEAVEEEVRKAGLERNYLMVTSWNDGAQRLYKRHGYQLIATRNDCLKLGNTEHLMEKCLQKIRVFKGL